jgi:hypothetical protein
VNLGLLSLAATEELEATGLGWSLRLADY